ncbi:MAG: hypothetical protein AAF799_48120 [Myxococcota bacterium]
MEALHQGASIALLLAGVAAALLGLSALWWVAGRVRTSDGELALQRDRYEQSKVRRQERVRTEQQRIELVRGLLPAATALVGHWLGNRSAQAGTGLPPSLRFGRDDGPTFDPPSPRRPRPEPELPDEGPPSLSRPPADEETQIELDLPSMLAALEEAGFGDWIASVMRAAKASSTVTLTQPKSETADAVAA